MQKLIYKTWAGLDSFKESLGGSNTAIDLTNIPGQLTVADIQYLLLEKHGRCFSQEQFEKSGAWGAWTLTKWKVKETHVYEIKKK